MRLDRQNVQGHYHKSGLLEHRSVDGEIVWLEIKAVPSREPKGDVRHDLRPAPPYPCVRRQAPAPPRGIPVPSELSLHMPVEKRA
jgi:hypothetical protein